MTNFNPEITCVQIQVQRSASGLVINVRTSPKLEEFFKNAVDGNTEDFDLRLTGRHWTLPTGANFLRLYQLDAGAHFTGIVPFHAPGIVGYRLDVPGRKILEVDAKTNLGNIINLSFLRVVGISKDGIEIRLQGVYSEPQVRQIHDGILTATNAFYDTYLRPLKLTINLQEG